MTRLLPVFTTWAARISSGARSGARARSRISSGIIPRVARIERMTANAAAVE